MNKLGMVLGLFCFALNASAQNSNQPSQTAQFKNADHVLTFEVLKDELIHFDYSALAQAPAINQRLATTPLILETNFTGASVFQLNADGVETSAAKITVDATTLCFSVFDKKKNQMLTRACPSGNATAGNALTLDALQMQNVYGLGEQFQTPGVANGDWSGKVRGPGNKYGNTMTPFAGGNTGNAQFPILYALGPDSLNYAFFLDTVYPYRWDFTATPWKISQTQLGTDPSFRGYFFLGSDLPTLRSSYMDLVGHPPVPPKKALGLWISEFGYRNWAEIQGHITTLRANHFPVDGFVLDLYWFGQYVQDLPTSAMGMLSWDLVNFPNPQAQIASFKNDSGVGIMTIEESYVSSGLPTYTPMSSRNYFVDDATTGQPVVFDGWWGKGSGIDWSNPNAGSAWHNALRKPELTDNGVTFHWTDLGEPESWTDNDFYQNPNGVGHAEADAHNLYNFYWDKSIFDGYESNHETARHFIMSRSGSPGIQRFGAAMWSGDIGSNMASLAGHIDAQMHMSLSGMDYYGADIGGFNRQALVGDVNEVYTRWLANASLFDVPMRPHTDDGSKLNFTAPDRIGDMPSNLANLRQRYQLAPYYYSLAYGAYRNGTAVVPPLVYYYQGDQNVRMIADEKMIGPSLLAATSYTLAETARDVYLPAGDWVDFRGFKYYHSAGQTYPQLAEKANGILQLPLFAKAGAIIPESIVDDQTMNMLGKRVDGSTALDLVVRAFLGTTPTTFNVVEDDGETESYRSGAFAETLITHNPTANSDTVTIAGTTGDYSGCPRTRRYQVEWVSENKIPNDVKLNGISLRHALLQADYENSATAWMIDASGLVHAKTQWVDITTAKNFEFDFN
jgi:alpha-glucosidase (family GH31 glycosyl hydrolase)